MVTQASLRARSLIIPAALLLSMLFLYYPSQRQEQQYAAYATRAPATGASTCTHLDKTVLASLSKSQDKEDLDAWQKYFNALCHGTYLELGALDGVKFSNTYMYAHGLNWSGVLIEANPKSFQKLEVNRPKDIKFHAAVCRKTSVVHYANSRQAAVAGIWEFMPPSFRSAWYPGVASTEGMAEVPCVPLQQLINKAGINFFDFFSLDVEGGELEVLYSIDFSSTAFGVIVIEADSHSQRKNEMVRTYLQSQGYRYRGLVHRNDWFVSRAFHMIYK
ncbi:MAG: hypothetical protein J3K34DRAFT_446772 [Monoraphidium minutum]|nr:MAG: hypothetical protein J3K34DRAFT_446772 [Monoraphidium minutum]